MKKENKLQSQSAFTGRKSYRKPSMASHTIGTESLIATSPGGTSGEGGNIPFGAPGFRKTNPFGEPNF